MPTMKKGSCPIDPLRWYKISEIAEHRHYWLFGLNRKGITALLKQILKTKSYPPKGKPKIKVMIYQGKAYNSPIYIRGKSLIALINYMEQYEDYHS